MEYCARQLAKASRESQAHYQKEYKRTTPKGVSCKPDSGLLFISHFITNSWLLLLATGLLAAGYCCLRLVCLQLVTVACDWFACDWFACGWLLLLATGYCCLRLVPMLQLIPSPKCLTADSHPTYGFLSTTDCPYPTSGCSTITPVDPINCVDHRHVPNNWLPQRLVVSFDRLIQQLISYVSTGCSVKNV
ncbi:hypothetical protein F511_32616 [Dorcoceras hygrometricum]|uniref:Uncharacterized protein n=1 Tax=Dorcoceras hygrometricum TaxID=472368 RepID=A0A2Z7AUY6_9LAMI|nr:hypothetical protein F511_32616 [Dorcoceras hygrometricum]